MSTTIPAPTTPGELRTEKEKRADARQVALVKQGIAWLDANVGPEWVERLDLRTLKMQNGSRCVLGQVFAEAAAACFPRDGYVYFPRDGYDFGIAMGAPSSPFGCAPELEEAWREVLA